MMEELAEAINPVGKADPNAGLRKAACEWATYVLNSETGELLETGIRISTAVCHYLNCLESTKR